MNGIMKKRLVLLLCLLPLAATGGFLFGQHQGRGPALAGATPPAVPEFHDMRINPVADYVGLLDPGDPEITRLAAGFDSYEAAYRFVSEEISFAPFVPPGPVAATLQHRTGSCLGKAALLGSLYRAMGMPAEDLRMVMGIVITPQGPADHVWLDLEHEGRCLQQDPSGMLGQFDFYAFPGTRYVDTYVMKESFAFNDAGFAVVSQLNRFRDSSARVQ